MFIGHFAPAFVAGAASPEAPRLHTLFIGAQLVDWAFFTFAIFGIEKLRIVPGITAMNALDLYHMPFTHSLLGSGVFAGLFALAIFYFSRNGVAAAWGAIVVMSHWVLDLLVHRPDLTIAGGSEKLGFGLWNQPLVAIPLELAITLLAFWWYMRRTKGPVVPPMVLVATMLLFQAVDWFGPVPEKAGPAMYLLALFSYGFMTFIAYWVSATRWHKSEVGLAVPSAAR